MEIGIDIESNERFKNMSDEKLEKIFTQGEINYAKKFIDSEKHFCAFWCVKESVIKAFSNKTIPLKKIEITHNENGKPEILKNDLILNELDKCSMHDIKISLSHSKDYSVAICILS